LGMRNVPPVGVLNELLVRGQPAHIQKAAGREMSSEERNEYRARMVRGILGVAEVPVLDR
jgi:protein-arginine kinase